ncbi:MAG: hypothetical protein U1E39_09855 [Planctomycetota bacterium]
MRKSTVVVLVILMVGMLAMTLLYNHYIQQYVEEHRNAKMLTEEFRADLEPGTVLKLGRTRGGEAYVVGDASEPGLVVSGRPTEASWRADPSGGLFARRIAIRLFEVYGSDRPVVWVEFRLTKPDGTMLPAFGYQRGEGRTLVPLPPKPGRSPR